MKKTFNIIILLIIVGALAVGGFYYWRHSKIYPSTDDAYIQANIVHIAAQITAKVTNVYVINQQHVKKGQLLVSLDPKPFQIALNKAKANLLQVRQEVKALESAVTAAKAIVQQNQATLVAQRKNTQRILTLGKRKLVSPQNVDQAISKLKVAQANLATAQSQLEQAKNKVGESGNVNAQILAAKATVNQAKLNLSYTKIYAPENGYVEKFSLRPGDEVSANQQLFAVVEDKTWWAQANFRETDLARIRAGQPATIKIDMYPNRIFKGKVQSISSGSGASFALLPPENATGNWVKVTQRFPVRIKIINTDPLYPLRVGASCTVTINTKKLK